ncbi:MAG: hypothetical protein K1X94_05585 [Sandaracinaceae bacterium]|nr:hypothetical protein [Sandaracinaceae bacterium]
MQSKLGTEVCSTRVRLVAMAMAVGAWSAPPASVSIARAQDAAPENRVVDTRPVEALVAVVGARTPSGGSDVVLLSDVELVAALALARGGATDVRPTPALLQAALDQIVGEVLIRREATRLGAVAPTGEEIARQSDAIARSIGGQDVLEALLTRHHASAAEIGMLAERRAIVERFLSANLEGASEVTEADVEEAYAEAAHPFAGRPLEEVREALRAWLRVTLVDAYVARWLTTLRGRVEVNVLRPFVQTEPATTDGTPAAGPHAGGTGDVGSR